MKVISVKQPQAALIMAGIKQLETRSFATKIRGRIGIHASLSANKITDDMMKYLMPDGDNKGVPLHKVGYGGHILGTVEVVDCVPAFDWCTKMQNTASRMPDYEREWILGDLSSDRYAWILRDPRPLTTPISARGRLGFWEYSALDNL